MFPHCPLADVFECSFYVFTLLTMPCAPEFAFCWRLQPAARALCALVDQASHLCKTQSIQSSLRRYEYSLDSNPCFYVVSFVVRTKHERCLFLCKSRHAGVIQPWSDCNPTDLGSLFSAKNGKRNTLPNIEEPINKASLCCGAIVLTYFKTILVFYSFSGLGQL